MAITLTKLEQIHAAQAEVVASGIKSGSTEGAAREFALVNLRSAICDQVLAEVMRARRIYPAFNSCHEGFAVLKEEVDELWDEVKRKNHQRDLELLHKEAVQVAAMAVRFIEDCVLGQRGQR